MHFLRRTLLYSLLLFGVVSLSVPLCLADERVTCPDGYAIQIPPKRAFGGSYLKCEDFDKFHELMDSGQVEQAGRLLIIRESSDFHGHKKRGSKRIKEPYGDALEV